MEGERRLRSGENEATEGRAATGRQSAPGSRPGDRGGVQSRTPKGRSPARAARLIRVEAAPGWCNGGRAAPCTPAPRPAPSPAALALPLPCLHAPLPCRRRPRRSRLVRVGGAAYRTHAERLEAHDAGAVEVPDPLVVEVVDLDAVPWPVRAPARGAVGASRRALPAAPGRAGRRDDRAGIPLRLPVGHGGREGAHASREDRSGHRETNWHLGKSPGRSQARRVRAPLSRHARPRGGGQRGAEPRRRRASPRRASTREQGEPATRETTGGRPRMLAPIAPRRVGRRGDPRARRGAAGRGRERE